MTNEIEQKLAAVAAELFRAKRVLFITGAGISADSGLPTYRGVGGLYNTETTEEGYPIEQCLSDSMFRVRPDITWKYMLRIGETVIQCQPNSAHKIIAQWERDFAQRNGTRSVAARKSDGGKVVVFTQNIDGYHRLAGSQNVLEIHGNLGELFCTKCTWEASVDLSADNHSSLAERLKEYGQDSVPRG